MLNAHRIAYVGAGENAHEAQKAYIFSVKGIAYRQFIDGMDYADFEKAVQDEINYDEVRSIQHNMREKSMNILEKALNGLE